MKDFHADPRTKAYKQKMKVAALLWKHVRLNPGKKVYRSELLDELKHEIDDQNL